MFKKFFSRTPKGSSSGTITEMKIIDAIAEKQKSPINMPLSKAQGKDLVLDLDMFGLDDNAKAQIRRHLKNDLSGHQLIVFFPNLQAIESPQKSIEVKPYAQRTRYAVIVNPKDNGCFYLRIGDWSLAERTEAAQICSDHNGEILIVSAP